MRLYLDACVVIRAQDAGHLAAFLDAAQKLDCRFAREVHRELIGRPGKSPRPAQQQARAATEARSFPVDDIALTDTEALAVYTHLRAGRSTPSDAGECHSIALASQHPDAIFVTAETKAGWIAIGELSGRTWALPSLLHHLVTAAALPPETAEDILAHATTRSGVRRPA